MSRKSGDVSSFKNELDELEPVVSDAPLLLSDDRQRRYKVAKYQGSWCLFGLSESGQWVRLRRLGVGDVVWLLRSAASAVGPGAFEPPLPAQ